MALSYKMPSCRVPPRTQKALRAYWFDMPSASRHAAPRAVASRASVTGGQVGRELNGEAAQARPAARPAARPCYLSRFAFSLAALALRLVGALVAAPPRPGSRLVALGEDHISSQESVVATSGDAAGSDLA